MDRYLCIWGERLKKESEWIGIAQNGWDGLDKEGEEWMRLKIKQSQRLGKKKSEEERENVSDMKLSASVTAGQVSSHLLPCRADANGGKKSSSEYIIQSDKLLRSVSSSPWNTRWGRKMWSRRDMANKFKQVMYYNHNMPKLLVFHVYTVMRRAIIHSVITLLGAPVQVQVIYLRSHH